MAAAAPTTASFTYHGVDFFITGEEQLERTTITYELRDTAAAATTAVGAAPAGTPTTLATSPFSLPTQHMTSVFEDEPLTSLPPTTLTTTTTSGTVTSFTTTDEGAITLQLLPVPQPFFQTGEGVITAMSAGKHRRLHATVRCKLSHLQNNAAAAQDEAWNYMMWNMVGDSVAQSLIRYVEPEMIFMTADVSVPSLTFHAPAGEASRIFYVSTGGLRGVYILALDDDDYCVDAEKRRLLLEDYVRRSLYEPLNSNQNPPPLSAQTLDKEASLQQRLPRVFTSATDLDGEQPLNLTVALAAIHYIIVGSDAWRGIDQFYACRNQLRIRKIAPRAPGAHSVLIKEEGDVLFIILEMDCKIQSFCDMLLAALTGYCHYINTKLWWRRGLKPANTNAFWRALTYHVWRNYYSFDKLLTAGYDHDDAHRIPLYCYVDTQHDVARGDTLGDVRTPYNMVIYNAQRHMEDLREQRLWVNQPLLREWAVEARAQLVTKKEITTSTGEKETLQEPALDYLGLFNKDSKFQGRLTAVLCPRASTAASLPEQQSNGKRKRNGELLELELDPKGEKDLYRSVCRESAVFVLQSPESGELEQLAVQEAALFLQEHGFVVLSGEGLFREQQLASITASMADTLTQLYVGDSKKRLRSRPPPSTLSSNGESSVPRLSDFMEPASLSNFPLSRGSLCRLDLPPLVYDRSVWREVYSSESLFQSFAALVAETEEGQSLWQEAPVQLNPLPPTTTYRKAEASRKTRIQWSLSKDRRAPYHGLLAVNSMSSQSEGGLVVAPGLHAHAAEVWSRLQRDSKARFYFQSPEHPHSLPHSLNGQNGHGERLPSTIVEIMQEQQLLESLVFVPLQPGDLVLWHQNLPHSWLRSADYTQVNLGQLYTLSVCPLLTEKEMKHRRKALKALLKVGELPYRLEGRVKAALLLQENSKPRNDSWIWMGAADVATSSRKNRSQMGWRWMAAKTHPRADTFGPGWVFDARTGDWRKGKLEWHHHHHHQHSSGARGQAGSSEVVEASYDYRELFRGDHTLKQFLFGTTSRRHITMATTTDDDLPTKDSSMLNLPHRGSLLPSSAGVHAAATRNGHRRLPSTASSDEEDDIEDSDMEEDDVVARGAAIQDAQSELQDIIDSLEGEFLDDPVSKRVVEDLKADMEEGIVLDTESEDDVLDALDVTITETLQLKADEVGRASEELKRQLLRARNQVRDFLIEYGREQEKEEDEEPGIEAEEEQGEPLSASAKEFVAATLDSVRELLSQMKNEEVRQLLLQQLDKVRDPASFTTIEALREELERQAMPALIPGEDVMLQLRELEDRALLLSALRQLRNMARDHLMLASTPVHEAQELLLDVDDTLDFVQGLISRGFKDRERERLAEGLQDATRPLFSDPKSRFREGAVFQDETAVRRRIQTFFDELRRLLEPHQSAEAARLILTELDDQAAELGLAEVKDALQPALRALSRLETRIWKRLSEEPESRAQLLQELDRIQSRIQRNEIATPATVGEALAGVEDLIERRRRLTTRPNLKNTLQQLGSEVQGLRQRLAAVPAPPPEEEEEAMLIVEETPPKQKEEERKRKRPSPIPVEEEEETEPSLEAELQQELKKEGIRSRTLQSILSVFDYREYSLQQLEEDRGAGREVGSLSLDSVKLDRAQEAVVIVINSKRRSPISLEEGDSLLLLFSGKPLTSIAITGRVLQQSRGRSRDGDSELHLITNVAGDLLQLNWRVPLNVLLQEVLQRGPRPSKRVRREPSPGPPSEADPVEEALRRLDDSSQKLQRELDKARKGVAVISPINYRSSINHLLADHRQEPKKPAPPQLVEVALKAQRALLQDLKAGNFPSLSPSRQQEVNRELQESGATLKRLPVLRHLQIALEELRAVQEPTEAEQQVLSNLQTALEQASSNTNISNRLLLDSVELLEDRKSKSSFVVLATLEELLERYKAVITRIRRRGTEPSPPPVEEEAEAKKPERVRLSLAEAVTQQEPLPLPRLVSSLSKAEKQQVTEQLRRSGSRLQLLLDKLDRAKEGEGVSTLQRNVRDLLAPITSAKAAAVSNKFKTVRRELDTLARKQWLIVRQSLLSPDSPLYYSKEVRRLFRDFAAPFIKTLQPLRQAVELLLEHSERPAGQLEAISEDDDSRREVVREELQRRRAEGGKAEEVQIQPGRLARTSDRLRPSPGQEEEGFAFD